MNGNGGNESPLTSLVEVGCDDYYLTPEYIPFIDQELINYYTWNDNVDWSINKDWTFAYRGIYNSNVVIEGIKKTENEHRGSTLYNNILGSALFYKSFYYYQLAQVFAPVYNESSAKIDWGIPIRQQADVGEVLSRPSNLETYNTVVGQLWEAINLLPEEQPIKTRPSKIAVEALLAKVYLVMGKYDSAYKYSTASIDKLKDLLIDFNDLDATSLTPFKRFNSEVIVEGMLSPHTLLGSFIARIDETLFNSFDNNDLRKTCYFENATIMGTSGYLFKGSYFENMNNLFGGIAVDEIILIRAECNARLGHTNEAMKDLNDLLRTRWKKNNGVTTYIDQTAINDQDALQKILVERRKELVFRGTRWTDLRRLNKEGANIAITRIVNGQTYTLAPNDKRYTYLIPSDVISFHPDMPQNPR